MDIRKKPSQIVEITPSDKITFRPPFNVAATAVLQLANPSDGNIAFKIKTTAPKRYCVRPNAGNLTPNGSSEIKITLQPGSTDERHKFMVQTLQVPTHYVTMDKDDQAAFWKDEDKKMMNSKLLCEFKLDDIPEMVPEMSSEEVSVTSEPIYQHQQTSETPSVPTKVAEKVQFKIENDAPEPKEPQMSTLPAVSTRSNSGNSTSAATSEEIKQLKARLSEALKQIEILSSTPPAPTEDNNEQTKTMLILILVAFFAGFILSSIL